jgi:hypothetical protein
MQAIRRLVIARWVFLLVAAALVAITVTPVLADHDWASGCSNGNTCWSEVNYGGGYEQSDNGHSHTNNDDFDVKLAGTWWIVGLVPQLTSNRWSHPAGWLDRRP